MKFGRKSILQPHLQKASWDHEASAFIGWKITCDLKRKKHSRARPLGLSWEKIFCKESRAEVMESAWWNPILGQCRNLRDAGRTDINHSRDTVEWQQVSSEHKMRWYTLKITFHKSDVIHQYTVWDTVSIFMKQEFVHMSSWTHHHKADI